MADTETTDVNPQADTPSSSDVETPAPAPSLPASDDIAPSSGASDDKAPPSGDSRQSDREGLLAAVKKVVETTPEAPAGPSEDATDKAPSKTSPDQAVATGDGKPSPDVTASPPLADPTEAELKKLRPETRRRFEQLLTQRNEARQTIQALQPELIQHRELQSRLQQNQLAPEDVNTLLGVGSTLRRGDYQGFLNGIMPYVMVAQEALGIRVSSDLQKQVDDGLIDEATARELTRTRHRAVQAESRLQDVNRVTLESQQAQAVTQIRSAVDQWEENIRRRDPDYAHMSDAVRRYAQGLLHERGIPRTPQEAVALSQAAYDEAKAVLARMQPAPRATRPSPSSIHVATGTSIAEPRTMKDAAVQALANMRRAS